MNSEQKLRQFEVVQEQLSAIDAISNLLTSSSFDLETLLNEIVEIAAQTLESSASSLRLYNPDRGVMELKAVRGLSNQYIEKGPIVAEKSIYKEMIENRNQGGSVVQVSDVSVDERVQYLEEALEEGIKSMLALPMLQDGKVIGAISIFMSEPHEFDREEIRTFKILANQAAAAISIARLHRDLMSLEAIEHELKIAADIQNRFMPSTVPDIEGMSLAGWNRACQEVGGDFYDYIELPEDNIGIALGDVSGKGIPAALLMAAVRTSLRVQAENVYSMSEVIRRVNKALIKDTNLEEFTTLFYAVLDTSNWMMTYINAGHNPPLLFRNGDLIRLRTGGVPVGLFTDAVYKQETIEILPGDMLVVYSDGFSEAPDANWDEFGEHRIIDVIRQNCDLHPADIINKLEEAVTDYLSTEVNYSDDRTVVILKALDKK
ncbi:MAG: SpoIIE family protein phosphatase [Candidatus Marinimicrobia bacterium]|nr:SpoIIE family protein phosphatase [Candidatus Neomarinimicrobiota bacterium]MCF7830320.1 SpoIIE family protein phosphatase [Candidatus Neomarinimicrobiota bacterium]MCF7882297.1 SpoIIE family protein phosphatase [Candidatus Neomarinimicrobiota bacterium]